MSDGVGIVVLNWNGGGATIACVESALAQSQPGCFVVLVDNGSREDERVRLMARYAGRSEVELVLLPENTGYAGGNNIGIQRAFARGAEFSLVANQDTRLAKDSVERLVREARLFPRCGLLGPRVLDMRSGKEISRGEKVILPLLWFPRSILRYRTRQAASYAVSGLMGCALLVTRSCFEATRGFDESFFAYYEEIDLCLRARAAGFDLRCVPQSVVEHDGLRGFSGGFTPLSAELKVRNLLRLIARHARGIDWCLLVPGFSGLWLFSFILYVMRLRGDVAAAMWRGLAAGLRGEGGPVRGSITGI